MKAANRFVLLFVIGACAARTAAQAPGPPHAHGTHAATARHSFENVEHWRAIFDDPARDAWQRPRDVVRALDLRRGARVADVGAGTGYFSRHLSEAIGPDGTVFAVDSEPNLVAHLRERAEREGTANVVPVLASPDNPRLPVDGIDLLLLVDTFHHIDDRPAYFRAARRVLRRGGRVAIVDWQKRDLPVGPPLDHKLAREQVVEEMAEAGYELLGEPKDLLPYQYMLIFRPR